MNILHVSASDLNGGAARASYRVHRALVQHGEKYHLTSRMRVIAQLSNDSTVISGLPNQNPIWRRLRPRLNQQARRNFRTGNSVLHSIAWPATGLGAELQQHQQSGMADLIHLHWVGDATISIEEIGRLRQPIVWRLADQWAFCGAEHYTTPPGSGETTSSDERFVLGYTPASRPFHESGPDLNRRTWLRKHLAWQRPMHIVCPSTWLADCARRSALMSNWPIRVIPNPLDLDIWAPVDQSQARALLKLPLDSHLVLFGALGGTADPRKGADLLLEALQILRSKLSDTPIAKLELVVFGQSRPAQPPVISFPIHYAGRLHDDISLRLLYAAADVMVVPSRQESFGQTATEAQACGTPVVAFRTGGPADIIADGVTGALAEPFDPGSLASAIQWVIEDPKRRVQLAAAARERAERLWNPARISGLYAEVYQEAMESWVGK